VKQIRKRLTYANVMSSIAVFLILGGATAFAAKKIGANEIKANSIKTGKIVKEAVTTSKIKNDAVTGAKVQESTLGQVPSAAKAANADTVGGLAPGQFSVAGSGFKEAVCDPSSATFVNCTSVELNLPHSGQVVLVGAGGQNSFAGVAEGTCEFSVDGVLSDTPAVDPGESATDNTSEGAQNGFALTSVTGSLPAGKHTFALACNQRGGDFEAHDTTISAQLVG
jgi:hypothetical protein